MLDGTSTAKQSYLKTTTLNSDLQGTKCHACHIKCVCNARKMPESKDHRAAREVFQSSPANAGSDEMGLTKESHFLSPPHIAMAPLLSNSPEGTESAAGRVSMD